MSVKKLTQEAFDAWVDACIADQEVVGIQRKGDRFAFGPLAKADELRLDYDVALVSPKKYFLPQKETLVRFDAAKGFESVLDGGPFVLFGVHPYDFIAIRQMDTLFSEGEYDAHYMGRRENATIVVSDVQNASENVFAGCMNTATVEDGFDVLVTKIGDDYLVDARTDKGEALLGKAAQGDEAQDADVAARADVWEANKKALRKHELKMDVSELPALLEKNYKHPVWEEKSALCYSCGSCNLVCPTCYCFDVRDDVEWSLDKGERYRVWDGCMLTDFALVAGDHNFRKKKADRYRHRYYRKGKYIPDRIGEISCVGCGRCITACTANIANPVEIYNRLLEDN
jgi:NAD-dependent dihydropyrimidine dehydrogenase PreA subunit